jgi:hypothetical protein
MTRRYYSSRKRPSNLTLEGLYFKLQNLYLLFREKYYFEEKAGITKTSLPDEIKHKAALALSSCPFPITKWSQDEITKERVFDTLEFLYDHVSKPDHWRATYDEAAGRLDFRGEANAFLVDYEPGFELTEEGVIVTIGTDGLQHILKAEIVAYDESNVDSKVRNAISKWRDRHSTLRDKKEAIRELADVFEWLKKTKRLSAVLVGWPTL